ncbi:MAG: methylmalonyl Co-A mutase-associated GTPase MeaB [Anaerolineae bacterium]|nr:MAG: methylmalonyl Co-A mutase-associated GTPase MeaB [Anaerolineae bacterium]
MPQDLVDRVLAGDRRAIARTISTIENDGPEARELLAALFPHTGRAHIVGVTGAPGTGKSTLVNELAQAYRRQDPPPRVGIIAVDPTSPFSGGALLGDRIRMRDLFGDPGVFIRSMATRGSLGGLARATSNAVKILDAASYEVVLVETVGAGQSEVDVAKAAHTTVVVEAPGLGDDVQAIKAGILEIADVFAVNKADREGVEHSVMALEMMLDLNHASRPALHHGRLMPVEGPPTPAEETPTWRPPICKTIATRGEGVPALLEAIQAHRTYLEETQTLSRRERARVEDELHYILGHLLMRRLMARVPPDELTGLIDRVTARELDPYSAAEALLQTQESFTQASENA